MWVLLLVVRWGQEFYEELAENGSKDRGNKVPWGGGKKMED